jgi:hypothetical protein
MKKLLVIFMLAASSSAFAQSGVTDPAAFYDYTKGVPACDLEIKESTSEYTHFSFSYPSCFSTCYPDNMVYMDFYEPKGVAKYPAVVFLSHIAAAYRDRRRVLQGPCL